MWAASATHMIARLTGSTLFANPCLVSIFASASTTSERTPPSTSSSNAEINVNLLTRMRDLRGQNPYALFIKENYSGVKAKHPDLKLPEISKKVAELWKSLSDEQKQVYTRKSNDQKANYNLEKKRLSPVELQTIDADEKSKRIQNRVKKSIRQLPTKRPRSAYAHFLSSLVRGEGDLKDFMKGAAQRWSQMAVQEKQKFEDLHQEEKQQYVKALAAWASAVDQPATSQRARSSSASSKTKKTTPVQRASTKKKLRTTSATGKRMAKKADASPSKSKKTKSTKSSSDTETSSSDDEVSPKVKKSPAEKTNPNK